jgi:serine/threonine protein kinase
MFGRYTIVRLLGSGGMGAVYEATHADLDKRVALKVLRPEAAQNSEARARFLREGRITARLRHPHVRASLGWLSDRLARLREGGRIPCGGESWVRTAWISDRA